MFCSFFIRRRLWLSIFAIGVHCLLGQTVNGQAIPKIEEIAAQMAARADSFIGKHRKFLLSYSRYECKQIIPESRSGAVLNAKHTIARLNNGWYLSRSFTNPGQYGADSVAISTEPEIMIIKDGLELEHVTSGRGASINKFHEKRTNAFNWIDFARFNPIDLPRAILNDQNMADKWPIFKNAKKYYLLWPWLPTDLVNSSSKYQVEGVSPNVVIVTSDWDEMKLSADKGFAILERKTRFGPGLPWRCEIKNSDFRKVQDDLWIPFKTEEMLYAKPAEPTELHNKVIAVTKYRVDKLDFDTVPKELFDHTLPIGTMVVDVARHLQYEVTGTDDPFSDEIGKGRLLLEAGLSATSRFSSWWMLFIVIVGFAIGVTTFFMLRPKK